MKGGSLQANPKSEGRNPKAGRKSEIRRPKSEGNPKSSPGVARTKRGGKEPRNTRNTRKKSRVFPAFRVFRVFRGSPIASILRAIWERRSEIRNPKAEARRPSSQSFRASALRPMLTPRRFRVTQRPHRMRGRLRISAFGFRISDFLRISDFGASDFEFLPSSPCSPRLGCVPPPTSRMPSLLCARLAESCRRGFGRNMEC